MKQVDLPEEIDRINAELLKSGIDVYQIPSRAKSIWQLCNTLLPYPALFALSYLALQKSFWLALPVILLNSGFLMRAFIIFHDCGHQSFFRSRKANHFWGVVTGLLTFTPFHYWSANHARHHDTSGNLDQRGFGDVWTMTVAEYAQASPRDQLKYKLYRNPFVMFFLGPLLIMLVTNRMPKGRPDKSERNSVYLTNMGILIIAILASLVFGLKEYLIVQLLTSYMGMIGGVWLFYVQHQFEDVYWAREDEWNFIEASLKGGSFYRLPKIINWFSGSIGYHHVHHLLTGIPNYNLAPCHEKTPIKKAIKPIGFLTSLKSLTYRLWDEEKGKLVGFKEARNWQSGRELTRA
jgi:omega-6 fatty acid desaturase (delta-12 desaturase)